MLTDSGATLAAPLFPDDMPDGAERVATVWDLSGLLPLPRGPHACPFCDGAMALKEWKLHARDGLGSAAPWRCDVRLKCMTCGYVPTFGVLVPQPMYDRAVERLGKGWIHWRAGRAAIEEASC